MNVTVKIPELDLSVPHKLKVVHAAIRESKTGNEMLYMLLREDNLNISVGAYVVFNMFDRIRNFASAFNIPISNGVLSFNTDELIGREVYARLDVLNDGSYVVKNFVVNSNLVNNEAIADLSDSKEDPFKELSDKLQEKETQEVTVQKDPFDK